MWHYKWAEKSISNICLSQRHTNVQRVWESGKVWHSVPSFPSFLAKSLSRLHLSPKPSLMYHRWFLRVIKIFPRQSWLPGVPFKASHILQKTNWHGWEFALLSFSGNIPIRLLGLFLKLWVGQESSENTSKRKSPKNRFSYGDLSLLMWVILFSWSHLVLMENWPKQRKCF